MIMLSRLWDQQSLAFEKCFRVFCATRQKSVSPILVRAQCYTQMFVPKSGVVQASEDDLHKLSEFIAKSRRLFVLTGAGVSTESGIRDYRSEGIGLYAISDQRPILHDDFLKKPLRRHRYWARNFAGWPIFSSKKPNNTHLSLAEMERRGKCHWLVTQNVDCLHTKAGSLKVTELHGSSSMYDIL